jgi:CelD/BcsL family acetyltransferase involved in cellulose biosynthesis
VPKIRICRSPDDLVQLRSLWEKLTAARPTTIFQDFDLNLAAAETFAEREQPFVVCAEASYGATIVPVAVRRRDGLLRLLGEELFDYRTFLHHGDREVLLAALAVLAQHGSDLEIVALREADCAMVPYSLALLPFCAAPAAYHTQLSAPAFQRRHLRLARNLHRMRQLGFDLRSCDGTHPQVLRAIYERKAAQDKDSLFRDPLRVAFLVKAASLKPERFEIFTLESADRMAAALVTLRDPGVRRFYTGWFAPELNKHSPGLTLIFEIARQALAAGLDCDFMTGEQPYKLRLAETSVPLYRLRANAGQLAALSPAAPELRAA